jgi:rRNA maturation RNase YbeY
MKKNLEKNAQKILLLLLTQVLKSAPLRKRIGLKLPRDSHTQVYLSLDLELVSATVMRKLNKKHRGKDQPTDVLSFPAHKVFQRSGHLGDIVICLPVLKAQAKAEKHSPAHELQVLLTHGVLHLLHFDHEKSPKHAREMALWEKRLLKSQGLIARVTKSS